jgi:hypothetical protein
MDAESYREMHYPLARDRWLRALELRREGKTYKDIGVLIGRADQPEVAVTPTLAMYLICRAVRFLRHPSRAEHPLRIYADELAVDWTRRGFGGRNLW